MLCTAYDIALTLTHSWPRPTQDWTNSYAGLPDSAKVEEGGGGGWGGGGGADDDGWPVTSSLCAEEKQLPKKTLGALKKHGRYMAEQYGLVREAAVWEELRYLVGTILTLVHGSTPAQNTPLIEYAETKLWHTALWKCIG